MSDIVCLRASSSNFDDICHLTEVSFHYDLANAKYNLDFKYDNFFVLYNEQSAISSGCITNTICQIDGVDLETAAVGIITTHPAERGKGYGLELMKKLIKSAQEDGYDLSLVFPWLERWYAKVGYSSIHSSYRKIKLENLRFNCCVLNYQLRAFNAYSDAEALLTIHQQFNKNINGTLKRESTHWAYRIEDKGVVMVAQKDDMVVAYMVCKALDANNTTGIYGLKAREFGCLDGHQQAIDALFCAQVHWLESAGFSEIYYEDVYDSSLVSQLCPPPYQRLTNDTGIVNFAPDQYMVQMYKILNIKSILRKLTNGWNYRLALKGSCWQDIFQIDSQDDFYVVRFIESGSSLKLEQSQFISLFLFGVTDWAGLNWNNTCTSRENEAMHRLFPKRKFVYWDTDSF